MSEWVEIANVRHFSDAYQYLGLSFSDFRPLGENVWVSNNEHYRVTPYVDEWGRSRRRIELDCDSYGPQFVASIKGAIGVMEWGYRNLDIEDYKKFMDEVQLILAEEIP